MNARPLALPAAAVVLVALVLGVQLAAGGADYKPSTPPSACSPNATAPVPAAGASLDVLTQTIVVDGVQRAACKLGTSRERLLLALPSATERAKLAQALGVPESQILDAVRAGLLAAVQRMDQAGALPPASSLLDDIASQLGLPQIAVEAVKRIPPSVVDNLLPTGAVLERAIRSVDLATVLNGIDDQAALERALVPVIRDAAIAEARQRLSDQLSSASGIFGLGG